MDETEEKSAYEMTEEELLSLSIPRLTVGRTLDDNLDEPMPYCLIRLEHPTQAPEEGLGALDKLPTELLQSILRACDLDTLANFRLLNRKADVLFRAIPEYRWLVSTFPKVLLAITRIRTGRWITYRTLYDEIHRCDCESCGDFACFLYLLTCRRVCYMCLANVSFLHDRRYFPMRIFRAHQFFGLSISDLLSLPNMYCVPGEYGHRPDSIERRRHCVDRESARKLAMELHGSTEQIEKAAAQMRLDYMQGGPEPNATGIAGGQRQPKKNDMLDLGSYSGYRFVAVVSVPWVNGTEKRYEWGVHCKGCREYQEDRAGLHHQRKFSIQQFRDHINDRGNLYSLKRNEGMRQWRHSGYHKPAWWVE